MGIAFLALFVVFMRRRKSSTSNEQPFYDYVAPLQQPTLPERIQLEENDAYGTHLHLTSSSSLLQYNAAYGVSEIDDYGHSELTSSLQSNGAYETTKLQDNDAYETSTTPSLQSNGAYGDSKRMILDDCVHPELTSSLQSNGAYGVSPYNLKMMQSKQTALMSYTYYGHHILYDLSCIIVVLCLYNYYM